MNVGTNGIVVDQQGNVLLIKRNDTRTFAPPGGAVDAGELPPDAAVREVREETGLIVLPVRLAALTYLPLTPNGFLGFTFRCLLRGGSITRSEESPVVGFFKTNPLPRRMSSFHRERVVRTLNYAAERPLFFQHSLSNFSKVNRFLLRNVVYRWLDLQRKLKGQPPFEPPPTWEVNTYLLCQNEARDYLWHRPDVQSPWQLPGGRAAGLVAPWETAVQQAQQQTGCLLQPEHLCDVYLGPQPTQLSLVFLATATQSVPANRPNLAWFAPGSTPPNSQPHQRQMVASASRASQPTQFHTLPPSGS
jgi:ADP-ribose pyrophosphatase YjhB (NUDIX family)